MPERYLFVELNGLDAATGRCEENELDLVFLLSRTITELADLVGRSHINLYCSPAINLFPKRADRIHLTTRDHEYHILPDRTRPMDFEVYDVCEVQGFGTGS